MGRKLLEKAGLVGVPRAAATGTRVEAAAAQGVANAPADSVRARTAPGTMLGFMSAQSAAIQEAEQLKARLQEFEGAAPAKQLDPRLIRPSQWANRHAASYDDPAFVALKAEIESAGGNVQAIKVRPLPLPAASRDRGVGPSNPPLPDAVQPLYEIVFGHRRHRACLDLGLPVLSVVEPVSEQQLFVEMERENRSRKDLSAWEQGMMYARALDQGLYPSNRKLADSIGRDLGDVGKALSLARLPRVVIEAFASPLELQYRWAKPLCDAQQRDPDGLIARAKALQESAQPLSAKQVFDALIGQGVGPSNPPAERVIKRGARSVAVMSVDGRGRTSVRIEQVLDEPRRQALARLIQDFLAS